MLPNLPPSPNGDFRGFPNSIGNFGHAGRNSGSKTTIVNGKKEGDFVILESSNNKFTFRYWFFADRVAVQVLKSEGEYCFLLEGVAGGKADAEDYFVTADGNKHIPRGRFEDLTPEWFYLGDPKVKSVLFMAKTPEDDAPNENHRQVRNGQLNMDLYSFGRDFTLKMGAISGKKVKAWWYNPKTGNATAAGTYKNRSTLAFNPPGEPLAGNDWVLVLDNASKKFKAPGALIK